MPHRTFDRQLTVNSPREKAWEVMTDVARLAGWVDIAESAREVKHLSRYQVVLHDRIGPFRLRADLGVDVTQVDIGKYIALRAEGEDRQVGARLVVSAAMELDDSEVDGLFVRISGFYEVTGKVASMSPGTINKKADRVLDQFFSRAADVLGGSA